MWIARDRNEMLFVYEYEPVKEEEGWISTKGRYWAMPDDIYPEVKWSDKRAKKLVIE